jgi:mono/diheme cytochrome c family protein
MKSKKETKKITQMFATRKTISQLAIVAGCMMLSLSNETIAQDGEKIFKQNCGVCHRVGGGRMVGPDLLGVTTKRSEEWLMKWTKGSQALIKSGDADAKAIYDEFNGTIMPDMAHIPDADIKAIYAFIASKDAPATASVDTIKKEIVPDASNNATPEEIERGKNIFIGSQALSNGGPACISCHNVNYTGVIPGGLLAKDLTTVYSRLGGDAGLLGMLGAPPFPAMTQAYKDRPLTEQEIAAITAFLNKVDKDKANQQIATLNPLLYGGFAGAGVLLVFIFIVWNRRKKHTVKKDIYDRQLKSIN